MKKLKFKKWVTNLLLTINLIIFIMMACIQDFDICLTSLLLMIGLPIAFLVNSYLLIEYGGI
jgi:uncharacterized membrane protein YgaE (UPF0421/DUF939 family)